MQFEDRFVAFVDILGFSEKVEEREKRVGGLSQIENMVSALWSDERNNFPFTLCPQSDRVSEDLSFVATQISDCAVLSAEATPLGLLRLVDECGRSISNLLEIGLMARGYISKGLVYHKAGQFFGSAYQEAVKNEAKVRFSFHSSEVSKTPFVELSEAVTEFYRENTDQCVKRFLGESLIESGGLVAVDPFSRQKRLISMHASNLSSGDAAIKLKTVKHLSELRVCLEALRTQVDREAGTSERVQVKLSEYHTGLSRLLEQIETVFEMDELLSSPFSTLKIGDLGPI
ncbi:hypothetical protein [Donghicola sp. XS_ASV15]|uniref:hypothetical protein n=1 Tax=Donghicola sp. XS_ASV15 TaxID=3241295 RepID=UPI0035169C65